jgi:hypothetical protein
MGLRWAGFFSLAIPGESADGEAFLCGQGGGSGFDAADLAPSRALVEVAGERVEGRGRALGEDFDAAVGEIFGVAGKVQSDGVALYEIAKANALHAAADEPAPGFPGHLQAPEALSFFISR